MNDAAHPLLLTAERIVAAYAVMTPEEKAALHAWEAQHVTGDGTFATSDWPGWQSVFARIQH
jgi:hypothetical protein